MSGRRYDEYDGPWYEPSVPIRAEGGIRAGTRRGAFGKSWWAKRWIAVLERFHETARLRRGRTYARQGQVLSLEVAAGRVTAQVQGSRPRPYAVEIRVKTLSGEEWERVTRALARQALYAAKLLAGEMPPQVEDVFERARLTLFPSTRRDLATECSCPDDANPCKHIAAVYYLLGEAFDRDPFLIFTLRGMPREAMLEALGHRTERGTRAPGARAKGRAPKPDDDGSPKPEASPESLPAEPVAFWKGSPLPDGLSGEAAGLRTPSALLEQVGPFPFWRGREDFLEALRPAYAAAAAAGLRVLAGGIGARVPHDSGDRPDGDG
ncbi:SWIM zinc finger family protein [Limnochorda pilosa]|uniref:SWIM-type domain-containing protein n=1 Tax=Limnochorda pilosa TaxID=1555112 RepID=A0A0K2SPW4_LIMPI|nr:SWIM zinc finger family protein [Limnochorda pilosa]BAS29153.1 hypothetical protein LIP_3341 [Limnochorda pilosa]